MKKIISLILALLIIVTAIPITMIPASAAETPIYEIFSGQKQILANGTNLYIEAGSTSGTSVYYMNGSKKTYVNPNGAKGDDLSDAKVFMGTKSYNDDYFDVTLIMSGGEVGTIYSGKPYGYLIGKITIAVIGTAKVGLIKCGSESGGSSDMHGAAGRLAIFDTVGVQITSGFTNVDGMIRRTESGWSVSGSAAIPEGVTMTVDPGQTVTVPADSYIENNGALVNNGTLELYGAVTGNSITGNGTVNCHTAYIENVSSVSSISAKVNGETVLLPNGQYRVLDGKLYIWLPDGNARVTLNSVNYYGIVSRGEELELTTAYTAPNDISGIPTEMIAYVSEPLSPKTNPTTFDTDLTFEVLTSGTTAEGARMEGSSLYASGAGTIKLKVTANDGYTSYSKTFDVTVKNTGYAASIANGNIVISKHSDTQIKITHAGFSGGSLIIDKDEVLLITGTSDAENDYGITVESGTVKVILKDVSITRSNSQYEQPLRINSGVTLRLSPVGTNSLIYNQTKASSSDKTNAGIHLPEGAKLIIDGEGSLDVQGGRGSDGIGTSSSVAAGTLIINSGTVTSVSGSSGSGMRGNVTINGGTVTATGNNKGVGIGGDITINDGTVTAKGGGRGAGIGGEQECAGGNITINGGTVTATGSEGAGIGGGYLGAGGNITINGGTVTAIGNFGAGIGGGGATRASDGNAGDGGKITIIGGIVTAESAYGAGIGGGGVNYTSSKYDATAGAGGTITISGGTVAAQSTASYGGAGIGGGGSRYGIGNGCGTVIITGGNVKTASKGGEAIGKGYNGTESGTLSDADGNALTLNTITLDGAEADTAVTNAEGFTYGIADVQTLDTDKLYFWLPADSSFSAFTAGGKEYVCHDSDLKYYTAHLTENSENMATCVEAAVCDICGTSYGEPSGHSTTAEGDRAATCQSKAYCSVCQSEYGELGDHTGGTATCKTQAICEECGEGYGDLVGHTGGTATCKTQAACEVCGEGYGELDPDNHEYEKYNGFCCDTYQSATLNADGYYEIANAGQLFWFANHINTVDRTASAVLVADIDLEGRPWTPIGSTGENSNNFRGVFDGQNHTIEGLYVEGGRAGLGFFGEVRTGTVKNFTIYGEVVVTTEVNYVGGVIGSICGLNSSDHGLVRNGAIIQNITSYVNLTAKTHGIGMIGGFVGYANHESLIENCSWYGTFDAGIYRVDSGAGGFIGKIQENTSEVTIRNCAAYGTIKTNYVKNSFNNTPTIYMGGFLSFSNTNAKTTLENCLFAGKFERGENLTDQAFLGAFGTLRSVNAIKNCYYLGDDGLAAVHSDSDLKPGSDNVEITSVTGAQLLSGEVAYKLGSAWGQTIGTDDYPVLGGEKVYRVSNCKNETDYSNTNVAGAHNWVDRECTACGALLGDVTGEGKLTALDLALINAYVKEKIAFDEAQISVSDFNCDGEITADDVTALKNYILGK